jgi:hypothetical protein
MEALLTLFQVSPNAAHEIDVQCSIQIPGEPIAAANITLYSASCHLFLPHLNY